MNGITTIRISTNIKALLDNLKVHPREPYEDVIKRLIEQATKAKE